MTDWNECPIGRDVEIHLSALTTRMEDMANSVEDIKDCLLGNGHAGIKAEVKMNSVRVKILTAAFGAITMAGLGALLSYVL